MRHDLALARLAPYVLGGSLIFATTPSGVAYAFPLIDPTNASSVVGASPAGTDLAPNDFSGFQSQFRTSNPAAKVYGGGWTILPRVTIQEEFTDNAFERQSPRSFDGITVLAPGLAVHADTGRVQMQFDYQPTLLMHAVNGDLNTVTQRLNMNGTVTIVPDIAYVDVRGLSGLQPRFGGAVGVGTLGTPTNEITPASTIGPVSTAAGQASNPLNQFQTTSFGVSPYVLGKFGEYGTGKLGISGDITNSTPVTGFLVNPFSLGGGGGGQSLLTTEQIGKFTTGEAFSRLQDTLSVDLLQSQIKYASSLPGGGVSTFHSQRETVNNQMSYALNRTFTALASFGQQNIVYSGGNAPRVNGLIWSAGMTITPNPDSALTVTYGRFNGVNSITANGHYAISARTLLSLDYSSGIGTQLENLQSQIDASTINYNGQILNALTGGPTLGSSNVQAAQNGVFRFNTLNASVRTTFNRDTIQASLIWSVQTNITPGHLESGSYYDPVTGQVYNFNLPVAGSGQQTDYKTASLVWTHELAPNLTMSTSGAYSFIRRSGAIGNDGALSTAIGLRYDLTESTVLTARYSFFDRISRIPGYTLYENILLLGVTKQF